MRKKKRLTLLYLSFIICVAAYIVYLRMTPNKHYARVFYHLGSDCERNDCSLEKRITLAQEAVGHDPSFSRGYTRLGRLLNKAGDREEAARLHQKAIVYDHKNRGSLMQLGIYHFQNGEYKQALRYLSHAFNYGGYGESLNYYLGRTYEKVGEIKKARHRYLRAYQFNPDNLEALARLGAAAYRQGDKQTALKYAQRIRKNGNTQLADALEKYTQLKEPQEFKPFANDD